MKRTRTDLPRPVREIEHAWIPLSDGCRLAARIWLPEDSEADPVPALLEYIPYRKNDATAVADATRHPYFAGHGYASVRVDMRGSGDSDGILYDEYLAQEQEDALDVIAWLASQQWCTGAVGMFGISWGGFASLQVAARRPPALRAIVTVCSTDDRYADDVHYVGGCLLGADMLPWGSIMLGFNARPPDPATVGERWRQLWLERLEKTPPFVEAWLSHQRRDAYWKHGSVCADYSAIECAVYAVGGWADGYTNAILRLLAGLRCPKKALIGPWSHNYPEDGSPGPAVGFLQECLRWWDHWLKGTDTGIMDEPALRAWMQDPVPPSPGYAERPGRWVAEPSWPSPNLEIRTRALNEGALEEAPRPEAALELLGAQTAGRDAGTWCPYGGPVDFPPDQREEDGLSLCFDSPPLAESIELLGFPEVTLALSSDRPLALVCVRLCDVAPEGVSSLVTRGLLNLTHRESHEHPSPLEPGRRYEVAVRLNAIGQVVPAGHRVRVAVSPTYWPWAWPSPEPVTLTLFTGASRLSLPVRPRRPDDEGLRAFEPPEGAPPLEVDVVAPAPNERTIERDVASGRLEQTWRYGYGGRRRLARDGLEIEAFGRDEYTIVEGDPLSATVRCEWRMGVGRGDWQTRVETASVLTADAEAFHVTNLVDAFDGNARIFASARTVSVARDLV